MVSQLPTESLSLRQDPWLEVLRLAPVGSVFYAAPPGNPLPSMFALDDLQRPD